MERETVTGPGAAHRRGGARASGALAQTSAEERNGALASMAAALRAHAAAIVEANGATWTRRARPARKKASSTASCWTRTRVEAMAAALEELVALPDPLGAVQEKRTLESGIELQRVSVPLGWWPSCTRRART